MDGWLKQKPSKHPRRASFCCLPRGCHASEGDMHREDEGLMGLRALLPGCASLRLCATACVPFLARLGMITRCEVG